MRNLIAFLAVATLAACGSSNSPGTTLDGGGGSKDATSGDTGGGGKDSGTKDTGPSPDSPMTSDTGSETGPSEAGGGDAGCQQNCVTSNMAAYEVFEGL